MSSCLLAQEDKVETILSNMTLDEKIGQMTQLNITTIIQDSILVDYRNVKHFVLDTAKLINYVKNWHVGSFINGRGVDPENWVYVSETLGPPAIQTDSWNAACFAFHRGGCQETLPPAPGCSCIRRRHSQSAVRCVGLGFPRTTCCIDRSSSRAGRLREDYET